MLQPTHSLLPSSGDKLCKPPVVSSQVKTSPEHPTRSAGKDEGKTKNEVVGKTNFQKASEQEMPAAPDGGSSARGASPNTSRPTNQHRATQTSWQAKQTTVHGIFLWALPPSPLLTPLSPTSRSLTGIPAANPSGNHGPGVPDSHFKAHHQEWFRQKTHHQKSEGNVPRNSWSLTSWGCHRNLETVTELDRTVWVRSFSSALRTKAAAGNGHRNNVKTRQSNLCPAFADTPD